MFEVSNGYCPNTLSFPEIDSLSTGLMAAGGRKGTLFAGKKSLKVTENEGYTFEHRRRI